MYKITIGEITGYFVSPDFQQVQIFSCDDGEVVYEGTANKIPRPYLDYDIMSIDNLQEDKKLVINIE